LTGIIVVVVACQLVTNARVALLENLYVYSINNNTVYVLIILIRDHVDVLIWLLQKHSRFRFHFYRVVLIWIRHHLRLLRRSPTSDQFGSDSSFRFVQFLSHLEVRHPITETISVKAEEEEGIQRRLSTVGTLKLVEP
jgi:hypothetical protein